MSVLRWLALVTVLTVTLMAAPEPAQAQPACPYGDYWPQQAPLEYAAVNVGPNGPQCSANSQLLADLVGMELPYEQVERQLETLWFLYEGGNGYQTGISLVSDPGYDVPPAGAYRRLMWGYMNPDANRFKILKCASPDSPRCIYVAITSATWRAPKVDSKMFEELGRNALTMGFLLDAGHPKFGFPVHPNGRLFLPLALDNQRPHFWR